MIGKNRIPSECEIKTLMAVYELNEKGNKPALHNILNLLNEKNGCKWKSQTVSTFLFRLVEKGYIESVREGRLIYYTCKFTKDAFLKQYFDNSAGLLFGGDKERMKQAINNWVD